MKTQPPIDTALRRYDRYSDLFKCVDMSRAVCERICSRARMGIWDIYHMWKACIEIPASGSYLEIGSAEGGSIILADEARRVSSNFKITAISLLDPTTTQEFHDNVDGIDFKFIEAYSHVSSEKIFDKSVDVLFLDGGKHYENAQSDLKLYWPKVKPHGYLYGHDFDYDRAIVGEEWAVMRSVTEKFLFHPIERPFGSTFYKIQNLSVEEILYGAKE